MMSDLCTLKRSARSLMARHRTRSGPHIARSIGIGWAILALGALIGPNALAQVEREEVFTYTARGEVETVTVSNPSGADLITTLGYDNLGNLDRTISPGGQIMDADYDAGRRIIRVVRNPNSASTTRSEARFIYDAVGRLETTRTGAVISPSESNPAHWVESHADYTPFGQVQTITDPVGDQAHYDYDRAGRLDTQTDPTGRTQRYTYTPDSRLHRIYEAVGTSEETAAIELSYTALGDRWRIRQARGLGFNAEVAGDNADYDTTYDYDAFNRLEQTVYPRPTSLSPYQIESFLYDANGNLEHHTTRRGDVISSTFDASNRLDTRTTPEGVYRFEYYLTGEPKLSRAPDGANTEWRTHYDYDFAGRLEEELQQHVTLSGSTITSQTDRTVSYRYDANGNRTRIRWPDGFYVTYLYDAANRLTTICYNSANCSTNLIARYEYDVQDRLDFYTIYGPAGASVVQSDFGYSIDSDLTDLDVSFLRPGSSGQTVSFDYGYDAAGRLETQTISNADWDWSPAQAGSPLSATYVANPLDQYASVDGQAFSYDLNGNLTAYRGQTLAYSSENRLETLSGAGVEAEFSYDAEGRRKRMLVGNTSTEFVHAGTMEIAEYDGDSGALLRRYIPGPGVDQRVLMITCGSSTDCAPNQAGADTYAYTADRLGHVVAVTHTQTGVIERYVYSPYGVELRGDESGNPFRYTGRRYDAETGLYYYRARYYDADLGRFLSTDPIGYADQWNLYAYVGNDPLNATDPTGENAATAAVGCAVTGPACPVGAAIGFVVGAAATAACIAWCDDAWNAITSRAEVAPPAVEPIPGETQQEFTDRVYEMCREACTDQVVDDYLNGNTDRIRSEDIGRCTHLCAENVFDNIDEEEYWPENYQSRNASGAIGSVVGGANGISVTQSSGSSSQNSFTVTGVVRVSGRLESINLSKCGASRCD